MDIRHVGDRECINCGECIPVCPTKAISWKGSQFFLHKNEVSLAEEATATPDLIAIAKGERPALAESDLSPQSKAQTAGYAPKTVTVQGEDYTLPQLEDEAAHLPPQTAREILRYKKRRKILFCWLLMWRCFHS